MVALLSEFLFCQLSLVMPLEKVILHIDETVVGLHPAYIDRPVVREVLELGVMSITGNSFLKILNLKSEGEEFECAQYIDQLEEVECWIRNIERQPNFSFWFQTSTDKFYPDFVCKLKDGRFLIIEYKGADRWSDDDSKEKRCLGEIWEKPEARSTERVLKRRKKGA